MLQPAQTLVYSLLRLMPSPSPFKVLSYLLLALANKQALKDLCGGVFYL